MDKRQREDALKKVAEAERLLQSEIKKAGDDAAKKRDTALAEAMKVATNTAKNAKEEFRAKADSVIAASLTAIKRVEEDRDLQLDHLRRLRHEKDEGARTVLELRQHHVEEEFQKEQSEIEAKASPTILELAAQRKKIEAEFTASENKRKGRMAEAERNRPPSPRVAALLSMVAGVSP